MEYPYADLGPTLEVVALAMLLVLSLAGAGVIVLLAALPGKVARARKHPQASAISVLGRLGLPTGVLWIVALAWAYSSRAFDAEEVSRQLGRLESAIAHLERNQRGPTP